MTIDEVLTFEEMQVFDRKSINIDAKALAITLVAFANADGGTVAIGISDKTKRIEGVDFETAKLNELLRTPFDYCNPTVPVVLEKVYCVDYKGRNNHIMLMKVDASPQVHANQADEVYFRVGDKSKLLKFEERLQLTYDKGERYFEDKPVPDAELSDIDLNLVKEYTKIIGYNKSPIEYLRQNKGFVKEVNGKAQISTAAILLFGKKPQNFFPRARVRFIRYEGTEEKVGREMNVIKDVIFEGTILKMIQDSVSFLGTQIKERTYLGSDGRFVNEEEYPEFVRQEIIVNAITHRAYSIMGTDIHIKMFDDHIAVESPGKLPGMVRTDNMRYTHFSRNPKIAEYLKAYKYVKEYGEGVDRMCRELEETGLNNPQYYVNAFMLTAIVYNNFKVLSNDEKNVTFQGENERLVEGKATIDKKNERLVEGKATIDNKNERLVEGKATIDKKNERLVKEKTTIDKKSERLGIENEAIKENIWMIVKAKEYYNKGNITAIIYDNIFKIITEFSNSDIIGRKEIREKLGYGDSKAARAIKIMLELGFLTTMHKAGKGKYRFKNENEE